jgi:hypothetical protein
LRDSFILKAINSDSFVDYSRNSRYEVERNCLKCSLCTIVVVLHKAVDKINSLLLAYIVVHDWSGLFLNYGVDLVIVENVEVCGIIERAIVVVQPPFEFNIPETEESRKSDEQDCIDNEEYELPSNFSNTLNGPQDALALLV